IHAGRDLRTLALDRTRRDAAQQLDDGIVDRHGAVDGRGDRVAARARAPRGAAHRRARARGRRCRGLVGLDVPLSDWPAVLALMFTCLGYALGPIIVNRRLRDAPSLGVIAGSLLIAPALYAPFAAFLWPAHTTGAAIASVAGLGVICTATAFLIFF